MTDPAFFAEIRKLIATDSLESVMAKLREALKDSSYFNEVLQQSGRFQHIRREIRLGLTSHSDATLTQNQIRFGLLDLLSEIETQGKTTLPRELTQNLLTQEATWTEFLREEFK